MRHHLFEEAEHYPVAVLIKASSFDKRALIESYISPLEARGIQQNQVIAFTLEYEKDKVTAKAAKDYLTELLPVLDGLKVSHLYVADATYFKILAGQTKAEPHLGYVLPCKIKGYEHLHVCLGINYRQMIYNPEVIGKLDMSLEALATHFKGIYQAPGQGIIHSAAFPKSTEEIKEVLLSLLSRPSLSCDIEAFSLKFDQAGIGSITFCWDEHNGVAFPVEYKEYLECPDEGYYGYRQSNPDVCNLLREFFEHYEGELTFHNAAYDVKVLIAHLWMKDWLDTEGLLKGLEILTRNWQDTKIIAYLATNSTAGNKLSLKDLAHEFAGNWAVEVKDIRKVPLDKLLEYNLIDGLCTHYVRDKFEPLMMKDCQKELYDSLMMPSQKLIIQLELTGMPLSKHHVDEVEQELLGIQATHWKTIQDSATVQAVNLELQTRAMIKANAKLKTKQHPLEKFKDVVFNPGSSLHVQCLLYEQMGLPIIDLTDTKQPATGADTIEKLENHAKTEEHKNVMGALVGYGKASKILSTFIPAFKQAIAKDETGITWLHGSFNLGGTVSGRLSSSAPNLQNIPSGSTYGKLIKSCFVSPPGWLFSGADFSSLEDYISALTTKDPNKLSVYERGFDGHCLRAAYYFRDELSHIDLEDPESVNTIKKTHPELRQDSKGPTFALTYQGTWRTLVTNLGWEDSKAQQIETSYHELYKVSDQYVQDRLKQASEDGFVEVAFGLRVRTPLLAQVLWGSEQIPYEAAAEGRTAGNALGQSYGLLNNRAAVEFMQKVWASPYRLDIKPVALIHDAIYLVIKDDSKIVTWANQELIKSMRWQELPEIQHPTVHLGAALDIFWPDWAHATTLPNDMGEQGLIAYCEEAKQKMLNH